MKGKHLGEKQKEAVYYKARFESIWKDKNIPKAQVLLSRYAKTEKILREKNIFQDVKTFVEG